MKSDNKQHSAAEILAKIKEDIKDMETEQLVTYLDSLAKSDAYVVIRDCISPIKIKQLKSDGGVYERFQVIKQEASESWTHDHTTATMYDIDAALTRVYGLLVRLLKESNIDTSNGFIKLQSAINKIEEKLGIEITDWSDKNDDEQGVKEDI